MSDLLRSRTTAVWLLLVSATVLSWKIGHGGWFLNMRQASVAVIVVAFVKARFVILDFMEIRQAPLPMRLAGEAWGLIVCTLLVVLYMHSTRITRL